MSILPQVAVIAPASADDATAVLVGSVALSALSPPSPDPAGIAYLPATGELLVSDSEVDEMAIYQQANLYQLTPTGALTRTGRTTAFSNEPAGLSFDPASGHLFVVDDVLTRVFEIAPGPDGGFGSADDTVVTSFSTAAYGNADPEDVAYDTDAGDLYVADGVHQEVYRVSRGANGVFDGVPPVGDDTTSHFDVARFGAEDSEGLGYDASRGTLLVLDRDTNTIYEVTRSGFLVNAIDISAAGPVHPADVVLAPGSAEPSRMNLYVVARGEDNDGFPDENDGMLYEMSVDLAPVGNLAPMVDAGPNQTVTFPDQGTLMGSAIDDGLPTPAALTTTWSQLSGPGTATFADPSSPTSAVSFSQDGTYVLRLTADDSELQVSDDVTVFVAPPGTTILESAVAVGSDDAEEAPSGSMYLNSSDLELVNDGSRGDQTVGLRFAGVSIPQGVPITNAYVQFEVDRPTTDPTSLVVQGQAADDAGTFTKSNSNISSRPRTGQAVPWDPAPWPTPQVAGPDQQTPNISTVIQEIVDRPGWASGNALVVIITGTGKRAAESWNGNAAPILHVEYDSSGVNQPPVASAGPDQQVTLPSSLTLAGSATDDGLPNPPGALTTAWTQVSGPDSVSFDDPSSLSTGVSFSEAGTYVLRLTADDGALQSTDELSVTVDPAPGMNQRPSVNAGADQQVMLPNTVTLAGSATDDGLPDPPAALTTTWSQVSGPGTATFADPSSLSTTASFSEAGTYVLRLTADDSSLQGTDDVSVTVSTANLVANPGFEVNTSGWNISGSATGVTLTRVAGGHSGGWAARLSNDGTAVGTCKLNDHPNWVSSTSAGTYTGSLWARADSPGATLKVRFREYAGGVLVGQQTSELQLTTSWQLVIVSHVAQSPGTSNLDFQAWVASAPVGTCFYADDVTISRS